MTSQTTESTHKGGNKCSKDVNSITEMPRVGEQQPEWQAPLHLYRQQSVQVWGNSCTHYHLTQHWGGGGGVDLWVSAEMAKTSHSVLGEKGAQAVVAHTAIHTSAVLPTILAHALPLRDFCNAFICWVCTPFCSTRERQKFNWVSAGPFFKKQNLSECVWCYVWLYAILLRHCVWCMQALKCLQPLMT